MSIEKSYELHIISRYRVLRRRYGKFGAWSLTSKADRALIIDLVLAGRFSS